MKGVPERPALATQFRQLRKVFVGGIPQDMGQDDLYTVFSEFAGVKKAWLQRHRNHGSPNSRPPQNHRGFGFVIFYDSNAVDQLLGNNPARFIVLKDGRKLEVKRAVSNTDMTNDGAAPSPASPQGNNSSNGNGAAPMPAPGNAKWPLPLPLPPLGGGVGAGGAGTAPQVPVYTGADAYAREQQMQQAQQQYWQQHQAQQHAGYPIAATTGQWPAAGVLPQQPVMMATASWPGGGGQGVAHPTLAYGSPHGVVGGGQLAPQQHQHHQHQLPFQAAYPGGCCSPGAGQAFLLPPGAAVQQMAGGAVQLGQCARMPHSPEMMMPRVATPGLVAEGQSPWIAAAVPGAVQHVVAPTGEMQQCNGQWVLPPIQPLASAPCNNNNRH